jgi:hypothetical protein
MDRTILERAVNSLTENCHNIWEPLDPIYPDAFLLENDPVVCSVCNFDQEDSSQFSINVFPLNSEM